MLIGLLLFVFVAEVAAEVVVMIVLTFLPHLAVLPEALVDAVLLSLLVLPALYLLQFRPLVRLFAEERQARATLDELNRDLEAKVEERTATLTDLNRQLTSEIEDRRRSDVQLEKNRDLMQRVLEASQSMVFIFDLEHGRCDYANAQLEKLLGLAPEAAYAMGASFSREVVDHDALNKLLHPGGRLAEADDGEIVEASLWLAGPGRDRELFDCRMVVSRVPGELRPRSVLCMAAPRRWRESGNPGGGATNGRRAGDPGPRERGPSDGAPASPPEPSSTP